MDLAAGFLRAKRLRPEAAQRSITEGATFTVTEKDLGTQAVRPGCMAELEDQRDVLLAASRMALARLETSEGDALAVIALRAAIAAARPL